MTDLKKKKRSRMVEGDEAIVEAKPNTPMLTIGNLPTHRGRKHPPLEERILQENTPPTKLLTLSDLPKLSRAGRKMHVEAVRATERIRAREREWDQKARMLKVFAEYVKDGMWKGRRCFIVGGGPSVKDVDVALLRNELTIGINRAFELLEPSILFGVDSQLWGWVENNELGVEAKNKFNAYRGYKVWMALHKMYPPDFYLIDVDEDGGYRIGTTRKLAFRNNSGYGAINLAAALGANPIYLLGFDMHGDNQGKQKWWHDGYPVDYGENVYTRYIEELGKFAPVLKQAGVKVVNLNPQSALRCFEFGDYGDVVRRKPVIPVGAIETMPMPGMVTAITPTGDRPLAFTLCKQWMAMQTRKPDQWIVVDDGKVPMRPPEGAIYIRRVPLPSDPAHTLNTNLKAAMPYVRGEKILIIEDDEYYAPQYVETMAKKLDAWEVVGIMMAKYYHLPTGGYAQLANTIHASLAQTGFKSSFLGDLKALLEINDPHEYLDMKIWHKVMPEQRGYLFRDEKMPLYVGIKGLPGRLGIGMGHNPLSYGNKRDDADRGVLRKWMPRDAEAYMDVVKGRLTSDNCDGYFPKITGLTVSYNTKELLQRAYESVRKYHPGMPMVIVDGSDANDPCAEYAKSIQSPLTKVIQPGYNIGHGRGMCLGIDQIRTPYALIFDSDIVMLKSPVDEMMSMMEPDTFGVGYTEKTGLDGYEYGAHMTHVGEESMRMLHPYFHLLNIAVYRKFHPYVHHGAPCYLTALDIHKQGLTGRIIKEFPGLGHTSGKGWTWVGKPSEWIQHDVAGTRASRVKKGQGEIDGGWVLNQGQV